MPPKHRILVIDDEEVVLDSCTQILDGGDCRINTASNGAEGLKRLEDLEPDVVFLDLKMPGLSGLEVLERIRAMRPLMVVIVITGYATVSSAVEAMKHGAYYYIAKPFRLDEVRKVVAEAIEKIRLRRENRALREIAAGNSPDATLPMALLALSQVLGVAAQRAITKLAARMQGGQFTLPLDNGAQIQVAVTIDGAARSAKVDFTGTSPQQINNFNAPTAVCMAAVLYVFRMLVDDDIPLNAGCLKPIEVVIPEGSMLRPNPPASVVAGNVETSTCITNAIIGALGLMGASQCTVNNFTFGNDKYQYYETISGGSGAGGVFDDAGQLVGGFPGTSVVQTHMTNSQVLEWRFPVRLESYEIRSDSGGKGQWNGGHGGVRRLRFLEPMTASILSNGRLRGAFGMAGGGAGAVGINRVVRASGTVEDLQHIGSAEMQPGDIFEIHTPGGGGFGAV